jgi:hypothetical protein
MRELSLFYGALRPSSERSGLDEQLTFCREAAIARIEDLTNDQAATRSLPATSLTIGGLIKHLALVEDRWFVGKFLGEELPEPWRSSPLAEQPDWPFESSSGDTVADLVDLYRTAIARSNRAIATAAVADLASAGSFGGGPVSVRWLLVHMIKETSWHLGHLDLLRDGLGVPPAPS